MQTMTPPKASGRYVHIDLLECIGIFLVLFFHGTLYPIDYLSEPSIAAYLATFLRALLSSCVPVFFFVNGYLLFGKPLDIKKHVKRLIRTVFLCFFWGCVLLLVLQPIYGYKLTLQEFWQKLLNWEMNWLNHLWYMGALVCLHIFFPLLKQAYDTNKKVFYYFVAICALMTFGNTLINEAQTVLGRLLFKDRVVYYGINYFNIFNPFYNLTGYSFVYFCCGGIMFSLEKRIVSIPTWKRNLFAVLGLCTACLCHGLLGILYSRMLQNFWDIVSTGYDTVFTFCIVICLYVLSLNLKKDLPLVRLISTNTLGIYLLHVVPHWALLPHVYQIPQFRNIPASLLYALGILFFTLGVCLILKKIPLLSKLL